VRVSRSTLAYLAFAEYAVVALLTKLLATFPVLVFPVVFTLWRFGTPRVSTDRGSEAGLTRYQTLDRRTVLLPSDQLGLPCRVLGIWPALGIAAADCAREEIA
jgi:hypothetical protein